MKKSDFPINKAEHYFYGSHAAWIGACFSMVSSILFIVQRPQIPVLVLVGMLGAILFSISIGLWNEYQNTRDNDAAVAAGELPIHNISKYDVVASLAGSIPVLITLLVIAFVLRGYRHHV